MATSDRQDDARWTGDALDRVIDEAVEAALGAGPLELRSQVLARLDEPVDAREDPRFAWLRPALLPVAGALLLVAGITLLWQHAERQLSQAGTRSASANAPGTRRGGSTGAAARQAEAPGPRMASAQPSAVPQAGATEDMPVTPGRRRATGSDTRVAAASWLEMDAAAGAARVAGAAVVLPDADLDEPYLPGAPAGDLGAPVAPMPKPRPIVIQPIATPPISEAPPISTLGQPVSTLSDEVTRDRQGPGKSGGMCP
jgi:hypothetical protein